MPKMSKSDLEQFQRNAKRFLAKHKPKDRFDKPSLADRALLGVAKAQTAFRKLRRKRKKKPLKTKRTRDTMSGLKRAGLSEQDIAKFRRKK